MGQKSIGENALLCEVQVDTNDQKTKVYRHFVAYKMMKKAFCVHHFDSYETLLQKVMK